MRTTNFSIYFSIAKFAYHRDSGMGKVMHATLFFTMIAGLLFAWKFPDYAQTGHVLSMVAFAGFFIGYWLVFCIGFLLQNSPTHACTVPHLQRKIRQLAMLLCLSISLIFSSVAGYLLGHFTIIFSLSIASLAMFWAYNAYFYALFLSILVSIKWWLPLAIANEANTLLSLSELAASLAYAWLCLQSSFPRGGDQHFILFKSLKHLLQQTTPYNDSNSISQRMGRLGALFSVFYRRDLNTLISTTVGTPERRMNLGLGPYFHWGVDIFLAAIACIYSVIFLLDGDKQNREFFLGLLLLLFPLMASANFALSCLAQLHRTRREQALLCLAPIIPQHRNRNHMLRSLLLRRFMQNFLMSTICVGLLLSTGMFLGLSGYGVWVLGYLLSPLFFVYVLQDYSQLNLAPNNGLRVVAMLSLIVAACLSIKWSTGVIFYFAIMGTASLFIFATYHGLHRWREMLTYEAQMPVGCQRDDDYGS